jgi:hypothetical protein
MELMDFPQLRKPTPTADKKLIPTTIFKYYRVDWTNDKLWRIGGQSWQSWFCWHTARVAVFRFQMSLYS